MVDILHRIGTTTTPDPVYDALTTIDGLAGWWTADTTGDAAPGGTIKFRFGPAGGFDMKVLDQRPNERVEWEVIDGPEEWIGTHVTFDLKQQDGYTVVLFQARRLERAGGVHAPLQHQVGHVPDEPQAVRRDRYRRASPERGQHQQLDVSQRLAGAARPLLSGGGR